MHFWLNTAIITIHILPTIGFDTGHILLDGEVEQVDEVKTHVSLFLPNYVSPYRGGDILSEVGCLARVEGK